MALEQELMAKKRELDPYQRKLVAGNGININQENNTIDGVTITPSTFTTPTKIAEIFNGTTTTDLYAPQPDIVELTSAQYDALPITKNSDNKAYFVTDIPDIKVWLGTFADYMALPLAFRKKNDYLFFVIPENAEEEEEETGSGG